MTASTRAPRDRVSLVKLADQVEQARKLERQIAKLKDQLNPLVAEIKSAMGDATSGTIGREVVVTWATTTRQTLDTANLKLEQPEIARKYLRTTTVRTFRFAEPAA